MGKGAKIPTLLGLGVLMIGLVVGVFLVSNTQIFKSQASSVPIPKNITVTNLSDTSASIHWQTDELTSGFVQAGPLPSLGLTFRDDRDTQASQQHKLHFVTLTNLTPNTVYYYKINSGGSVSSDKVSTFKTVSTITPSNQQPLIGTILDPQSKPVTEAIVTIEVPGAQPLSTITKIAGNFILPLANLYTKDLLSSFNFDNGIILNAKLTISDSKNTSEVTLQLPAKDSLLPTIILGQNLDLTTIVASPTSTLIRYDVNNDGVVNSLDMSIILKNFGKNPKDKQADLNQDGVVDQKDIDLVNKMIPNISPR